eukprot:1390410-Amphidinium_carterae.1
MACRVSAEYTYLRILSKMDKKACISSPETNSWLLKASLLSNLLKFIFIGEVYIGRQDVKLPWQVEPSCIY